MGVLAIVLVVSFSLAFFGFGTKAQNSDEEILYKYYKSIVVEEERVSCGVSMSNRRSQSSRKFLKLRKV